MPTTQNTKVRSNALTTGTTVRRFKASWTVESVTPVRGGYRVAIVRVSDGYRHTENATGATRWEVQA